MIKAHIKHTVEKLPTLVSKEKGNKCKPEDISSVLKGTQIDSLENLRAAFTTLKEQQTELRPMNFLDNKIQFLKDFKQSEILSNLEKRIKYLE